MALPNCANVMDVARLLLARHAQYSNLTRPRNIDVLRARAICAEMETVLDLDPALALAPWRPKANAHVVVTSRNPNWDKAVPLVTYQVRSAPQDKAGWQQLASIYGQQQQHDR